MIEAKIPHMHLGRAWTTLAGGGLLAILWAGAAFLVGWWDLYQREIMSVPRRVVCVALTSNLRWAEAPGNVLLSARLTGLPKDSVANVSQIVTLDRTALTERVGALSENKLGLVILGVDIVLGR